MYNIYMYMYMYIYIYKNINLAFFILKHEYAVNISKEEGPLLYSRQIHYINFTRHDCIVSASLLSNDSIVFLLIIIISNIFLGKNRHHLTSPIQINVIRDPIDRLISTYYYRIYGSKSQNRKVLKICENKVILFMYDFKK